MRNACKFTRVFPSQVVACYPNTNSKNRSQQNHWHMHAWCICVWFQLFRHARAPRDFSLDWSQFPWVRALANNRLSATLAFLPRKTSFLRMHLLEISKGQVSGAATADLSYKVLQPIQRLNATRNSIHMHYVHFSCSLVVYSTFVRGSQCIKGNLSLAPVCFHHAWLENHFLLAAQLKLKFLQKLP